MSRNNIQCINVVVTTTTSSLNRHEIVEWVNDCLNSRYYKVEDLSTGKFFNISIYFQYKFIFSIGDAYCNFLDMLHPGLIRLDRVKFCTKLEYEKINNFRIFQQGLTKIGCSARVPVEKLVKGRFQDNFEFIQWFKLFFDRNYVVHDYDPTEARGGRPLGSHESRAPPASRSVASNSAASAAALIRPALVKGQIAVLEEKITEVQANNEHVLQERDFYFEKLREIELLCQENSFDAIKEFKERILEILYKSAEGFQAPEENIPDDGYEDALDCNFTI